MKSHSHSKCLTQNVSLDVSLKMPQKFITQNVSFNKMFHSKGLNKMSYSKYSKKSLIQQNASLKMSQKFSYSKCFTLNVLKIVSLKMSQKMS